MGDGSTDTNRPFGPIFQRTERQVRILKMTARAEAHTRNVVGYINRNQGQDRFSTAEIAEAYNLSPKRVANVLSYLVRRGDLVHVLPGLFERAP